jgi:hypothetical protein
MASVWHDDPALKGHFHPTHPDDLQVLVHDGGPRLSQHPPELMWVRVTGKEQNVYSGTLLNVPQGLKNVKQGTTIRFLAPKNPKLPPTYVTEKYLTERSQWIIKGCDNCGFDELFDAPSDLIRKIFPDVPSDLVMTMFSSFCPLCRGVQVISAANLPASVKSSKPSNSPNPPKRKWWEFWK